MEAIGRVAKCEVYMEGSANLHGESYGAAIRSNGSSQSNELAARTVDKHTNDH